jgi:hypothetical protein
VHSLQPVIDATPLIGAFHQSHDYAHLAAGGGGGAKKPASYWGGREQQANYDMALARGGWRHGLIEFSPWSFVATTVDGALPLKTCRADRCAALKVNRSWRPLGLPDEGAAEDDRVLADLAAYVARCRKLVPPARRHEFDALHAEALADRRR